jgi:hypothetical protein
MSNEKKISLRPLDFSEAVSAPPKDKKPHKPLWKQKEQQAGGSLKPLKRAGKMPKGPNKFTPPRVK